MERFSKGCFRLWTKDEFVSEHFGEKKTKPEKKASWTQFLHVTNHAGHRVAGCLPIFVAGR